jgi:hypothetical protein
MKMRSLAGSEDLDSSTSARSSRATGGTWWRCPPQVAAARDGLLAAFVGDECLCKQNRTLRRRRPIELVAVGLALPCRPVEMSRRSLQHEALSLELGAKLGDTSERRLPESVVPEVGQDELTSLVDRPSRLAGQDCCRERSEPLAIRLELDTERHYGCELSRVGDGQIHAS